MGAVRVTRSIASRFTRVVCAKCATGGMMMLSVVLSIRFTVNKILKYQSGRKHELTNDMMKSRRKGKEL